MDYVSLMNAGAMPETCGKQFAHTLLENSAAAGEFCLDTVANFINNCMHAVGLNEVQVQRADVMSNFLNYQWPNTCLVYKFEYNAREFQKFELFLKHVCMEFRDKDILATIRTYANQINLEPHEYLLNLIDYWDAACDQLIIHNSNVVLEISGNNKTQFDEPLARLDLPLLVGLHLMQNTRGRIFSTMNTLLMKTLMGIYFDQSHFDIFVELLNMYKSEFYTFYMYNQRLLNFFYEVFALEGQGTSHALLFRELRVLLNKELPQEQKLVLINYLIKPRMLKAYYTIYKTEPNRRIISYGIEFLDKLQEKIPSAECFTQAFLESILCLVLRFDRSKTGEMAAKLYKKLATRLQDNETIFKHVLAMYASMERSPDNLSYYVSVMCDVFPFMRDLNMYTQLLTEMSDLHPVRFVAAHMMLATYKKQMCNIEFAVEIEDFLVYLPYLLDAISCNVTYGIVLRAFEVTDFNWLLYNLPNGMELIEKFEAYALDKFTNDALLPFDVLHNLLIQLLRCLRFSLNWDYLENTANDIGKWYLEMSKKIHEYENQVVPVHAMYSFSRALQKLCILLMHKIDGFRHVEEIYADLANRLLNGNEIFSIGEIMEIPLDLYASEAVTECTIGLAYRSSCREQVLETAMALADYFIESLNELETRRDIFLPRVKSHFTSLIGLLMDYNHNNQVVSLQLDSRLYNLLIQTIIISVFEQKADQVITDEPCYTHVHPIRICENKHLMICKFAELHTKTNLIIPGNQVWKLCIFYGLPTHKMNDGLTILLRTLAAKQKRIYKHIVSVIIYNLYKRTPPLTDMHIKRAIKMHVSFVNVYVAADECNLIKSHIILGVLDICRKSLQVLKVNPEYNRMEAVSHLHLLLPETKVVCTSGMHDIKNQLRQLQNNLFTEKERKTLMLFFNKCMVFCKCEQEGTLEPTRE